MNFQRLRFRRFNLQTGSVSEGEFTGHHHHVLGEPDFHPARTVLRVAQDAIARWNRQQPKNWRYELIAPVQSEAAQLPRQ